MGKISEKVLTVYSDCASARSLSEVYLCGKGRLYNEGKEYVDMCSNDYIGLSHHPEIADFSARALSVRVGTGSSRLMSGSTQWHHLLEKKVAEFKHRPEAIVLNSGYQANIGVIPALVGRGDCVFSDRLNHASIIDGIKLSGARCFRFRHNDTCHMRELAKKHRKKFKKALIITESVFSMDGDEAPLRELVEIKKLNDCLLMVDEAHATGIFGLSGNGLIEENGLSGEVDLVMGTFSKALGVFGAYIATDVHTKQLLVNECRSFIYSTALPVSVVAGCCAAIDIVKQESWRREQLLDKVAMFREKLNNDLNEAFQVNRKDIFSNFVATTESPYVVPGRSQIVPVVIGDNLKTLQLVELLKERNWWVKAIRPPTVPEGSSRLRLSITIEHGYDTLELLVRDIVELLQREGINNA